MIKHYITTYVMDGVRYAESWIQINLFKNQYCFSKRRVKIPKVK